MRTVALLLDDPENLYQQLLVREAREAASRQGLALLPPEFARGSSWTQLESINAHLRREPRPEGVLVMLAGGQFTPSAFERVVKAGIAVVFLNRIPPWGEDLRTRYPQALVAGVAPHQFGIGQIQARHAHRLAPRGGFVVLITGEAASPAAAERKRGFVETVGGAIDVHVLDGQWSAAGAEKALADWFRIGAERGRPIDLVVCHNDAMAEGARKALARQAASSGRKEIALVPIIGCDGLREEGLAMLSRGELVATVVVPPTTPPALEMLRRYWDSGAKPAATVLVEASPYPPLDQASPRS
jgi:ABC-type sugar transport system substrate-binding protein